MKAVNSIPFKREDDDIEGIGPGTYDPNSAAVHRKAPITKIAGNSKAIHPSNVNKKAVTVTEIIKAVTRKEPTMNEQISNHRINHQNAVFVSKTSRNGRFGMHMGPGPGAYNATFDHKYIKNLPQGFGSTTERNPLGNRNVMDSPFCDPTHIANPGVGAYGKQRKYLKETKQKSKVRSGSQARLGSLIYVHI